MQKSTWTDITSVSELSVLLETGYSNSSIYGNGSNQILVRIYITAADSNRMPIQLSEDDIQTYATLVDYTDGSALNRMKSNTGWNYSTEENRYHHTIPPQSEISPFNGNGDSVASFYVMCATNEPNRTKSISVNFTLPDGTIYSTAKNGTSGFESKVTLTALETKFYTLDDTETQREDTADFTTYTEIDQDNYYFRIKDNSFHWKFVSVSSDPYFDTASYSTALVPSTFIGYDYVHHVEKSKCSSRNCSICQVGEEGKDYVGGYVNQNSGQITLTRYLFKEITTQNVDGGTLDFIAYDQYGNYGKFIARMQDSGNTISISNG